MRKLWLYWNVLIVISIFILTVSWEFVLEDPVMGLLFSSEEIESTEERWEFVITSLLFVVIALIAPTVLAFRNIRRREKVEEELKQSQEQLLHTEKLRAIGKLTASIAHEFNNPIYGIRNVLEKISEEVELNDRQRGFVNMATDECNRVKDLIRKLQDFNRSSSRKIEMLDIHHVIDEMLILMKKKLQEKQIQLKKNYAANVPKIPGISDQIKQVILNLVQNGEEAVTRGGVITITTRVGSSRLQVEVEDNGSGILPENRGKIFEPFFTTKSLVKGIGLGLSVTHGIVEAHGGKINVHSLPGKGTSFIVELPFKRAAALKNT